MTLREFNEIIYLLKKRGYNPETMTFGDVLKGKYLQ